MGEPLNAFGYDARQIAFSIDAANDVNQYFSKSYKESSDVLICKDDGCAKCKKNTCTKHIRSSAKVLI